MMILMCIYCINDTSALGAVQAVEDAGKTGEIDILEKTALPSESMPSKTEPWYRALRRDPPTWAIWA